MPALEFAAPPAAQAAPGLNRPFTAALMLANFGTNVALIAPIENVLPRMVEAVSGGDDKAIGLGLVTGLGALAALVFNPLAGHYSDRWVSSDNRTRLILTGLVAGGIAHAVLGLQHSLAGIAVWWVLCQATINVAYAPMTAIVVDHVDRRSWGLVWGLISGAQAVGLIAGLAAVVLVFPSVEGGMFAISAGYVLCLIPLLLVLHRLPRVCYLPGKRAPLTPVAAPPGPLPPGPTSPAAAAGPAWLATVRALLSAGPGFGLVWVGKFLVTLAETIALLYLYYYLQDVVHYGNPGQGQLILVVIATVAVIIATIGVGRVADLSAGYRRYAVLSSILMAATGFVLAGFASWSLVIVASLALGAGYGAFQSVSQALSLVVLPSRANAGRDLGIINVASAVPQVIGAPVAGLVVAEAGGYRGLFVFAGLLALAAAAVFTRVPTPSPVPPPTPSPPPLLLPSPLPASSPLPLPTSSPLPLPAPSPADP